MTEPTIGVGIVGANIHAGFAHLSHIPALQALPEYAIAAVCTTRTESAEEAASALGAHRAFTDARSLAEDPAVDLVVVSVRVPGHCAAAMAAIEAGKHVYCEWPLASNTDEARTMAAAAASSGVQNVVGLQGRGSPQATYMRDLVRDGHIGTPLAATMTVRVPAMHVTPATTFYLDRDSPMNAVKIQGGHSIDLLRYVLGEIASVAATELNQRPMVTLEGAEDLFAKTVPDQLLFSAATETGIAISYQLWGGGHVHDSIFSFEIHGDEGDLWLAGNPGVRDSMQRQHLRLFASQQGRAWTPLEPPATYRLVPEGFPVGTPFNIGQMYARLAHALHDGTPASPDFAAGVRNHEVLDAVLGSSSTGTTRMHFHSD